MHSSRPSSRKPPASMTPGPAPLTAEREMMGEIRAKLERAQRRLAHSVTADSALSARYIPSSEYASLSHKPPVRSVRMEDMPATVASNAYYLPPPSTRRPERSAAPPPSKYHHHSSHHRHHRERVPPPSGKQYQSRSKYAGLGTDDPLNGGPPPMSTPYLVYSNSAPMSHAPSRHGGAPTSGYPPESAYGVKAAEKSSRSPPTKERGVFPRTERATAPPMSTVGDRRRTAAPPSSRVRFDSGEAVQIKPREPEREREKAKQAAAEKAKQAAAEKARQAAAEKPKQRGLGWFFRRQDARSTIDDEDVPSTRTSVATKDEKTAPAAKEEKTHGDRGRSRRSSLVANPPKSEIKVSAFAEGLSNIPSSPVGRTRRGSTTAVPPKSNINVAAFADLLMPRRSSAPEAPVSTHNAEPASEANIFHEAEVQQEVVESPAEVQATETQATEVHHHVQEPEPVGNQQEVAPVPVDVRDSYDDQDIGDPLEEKLDDDSDAGSDTQTEGSEEQFVLALESPVLGHSVIEEETNSAGSSSSEEDASESDMQDFDDFDVDSLMTDSQLTELSFSEDDDADELNDPELSANIDNNRKVEPARAVQEHSVLHDNRDHSVQHQAEAEPSPEDDKVPPPAPSTKLTPRQIALQALGRDVSSTGGNSTGPESQMPTRVPSSFRPSSMAPRPSLSAPVAELAMMRHPVVPPPPPTAIPSRLSNIPRGPTVSRPKPAPTVPPAPQTAGYVRRSRLRQSLEMKRQLPPSIGALSGLSDGPTTFTMDESEFYVIEWKVGEFGFSFQRVYCDGSSHPRLFLRMLLNTDRSICKSFRNVRVGDILIRVGNTYVSELGLEGSSTVLTKFFERLQTQTPIRLTFQRMYPSEWEGGVEL